MQSIVDWKNPEDQTEAIESVENYYEKLKDYLWNPEILDQENKEMRKLESEDSFLAAGKRNLQKIVPPKIPHQDEIEGIINE